MLKKKKKEIASLCHITRTKDLTFSCTKEMENLFKVSLKHKTVGSFIKDITQMSMAF